MLSCFSRTAAQLPGEIYPQGKGLCIIVMYNEFLHNTPFSEELTKNDTDALVKAFSMYNVDIVNKDILTEKPYVNLTKKETMELFEKVSQDTNLAEYKYLAVCISSHGLNGSFSCYDEDLYIDREMLPYFTADKCSALKGKPKMFFIDACQGRKNDVGVKKGQASMISMPIWADFLVVFSSYIDYTSTFEKKHSRFIRAFANVLSDSQYKGKYDLITLLTLVNRQVADMGAIGDKQMSYFRSTCTKFIKLEKAIKTKGKEEGENEGELVTDGPMEADSIDEGIDEAMDQEFLKCFKNINPENSYKIARLILDQLEMKNLEGAQFIKLGLAFQTVFLNHLSQKLTDENVIDILLFAKSNNLDDLKAEAIKYLRARKDIVRANIHMLSLKHSDILQQILQG